MEATPSQFDCLLRTFSRAQAAIDRATIYRPRCGRRTREYRSERDALAYERGYHLFPLALPSAALPGMPIYTGWMDAEAAQQERDDARRDEAYEARFEDARLGDLG